MDKEKRAKDCVADSDKWKRITLVQTKDTLGIFFRLIYSEIFVRLF